MFTSWQNLRFSTKLLSFLGLPFTYNNFFNFLIKPLFLDKTFVFIHKTSIFLIKFIYFISKFTPFCKTFWVTWSVYCQWVKFVMSWQFSLCKYYSALEFVAFLIRFYNSNGDIIFFFNANLLQLSLNPNKGVIAFC
jgi:hypothetical protein